MAGRPRPVTRKLGGMTPIQLAAQQRGRGNAYQQLTAGLGSSKSINGVAPRKWTPARGFGGNDLPLRPTRDYTPVSVAKPKALKDFKFYSSRPHWDTFSKVITHRKITPQERDLWTREIEPEVRPYKHAADLINSKNPKKRADFVEMLAADTKNPQISKVLTEIGGYRKKSWEAAHPKKDWYDHVRDFATGAVKKVGSLGLDVATDPQALAGDPLLTAVRVVANRPAFQKEMKWAYKHVLPKQERDVINQARRKVTPVANKALTAVVSGTAGEAVGKDRVARAGFAAPNVEQIAKGIVGADKWSKDFRKSIRPAVKSAGLETLHQYARIPHGVLGYPSEVIAAMKRGESGTDALRKAGLHGVYKGLVQNHPYGGGQILNQLGIHNKAIAGSLGFVVDAATDPATYVGGGSARVARSAGEAGARKVATNAGVQAALEEATVAARKGADFALLRELDKTLNGAEEKIVQKIENVRRDRANHPRKTPLTDAEASAMAKRMREQIKVPDYVERDIRREIAELEKVRPVTALDRKLIAGRITAQAILPAKTVKKIVEREYQSRGVGDIEHLTGSASKKAVRKGFYDSPLARSAAARAEQVAYERGAFLTYGGKILGRTRRDPLGLNLKGKTERVLSNGKIIPADRRLPVVMAQQISREVGSRRPSDNPELFNSVKIRSDRNVNARIDLRNRGVAANATVRPSGVNKLDWEQMNYLRAQYEAERTKVRRIADFVTKNYGQRIKVRDNPDFVQVLEHQIVNAKQPFPRHLREVGKQVTSLPRSKQRQAFTSARAGIKKAPKQGSGLSADSIFASELRKLRNAGWSKRELQIVRQLRSSASELDALEELVVKRVTNRQHQALIDRLANSRFSSTQLKRVKMALANREQSEGLWSSQIKEGAQLLEGAEFKDLFKLDAESRLWVLEAATARRLLAEHPEWAAKNGNTFEGLAEATQLRLAAERKNLIRSGKYVNNRANYFPHIDLEHYNKAFESTRMMQRLGLGRGKPLLSAGKNSASETGIARNVPFSDVSSADALASVDPYRFGRGEGSIDLAEGFLAPREIDKTAVEINGAIKRLRNELSKPLYMGVSVNVPKAINSYMRAIGYQAARLRYQDRVLSVMGESVYKTGAFDKPTGTVEKPLLSARAEAKTRAVIDGHAEDMENYERAGWAFKENPTEENALNLAKAKEVAFEYQINGLGLPVRKLTEDEAKKHFWRIAKQQMAADRKSADWIDSVVLPAIEAASKMQRDLLGMRGSLNAEGLAVSKQGVKVMDQTQRSALRAINELDKEMVRISDELASSLPNANVDPLAEFRSTSSPVSDLMRPWLQDKFAVDFALLDDMIGGSLYRSASGNPFKQAQTLAMYDEMARKFLLQYAEPLSYLTLGGPYAGPSNLLKGLDREFLTDLADMGTSQVRLGLSLVRSPSKFGVQLNHPAFQDTRVLEDAMKRGVVEGSGIADSVWDLIGKYDFASLSKNLKLVRRELVEPSSNLNWTRQNIKTGRGLLYPGDSVGWKIREVQERLGRPISGDDPELANAIGSNILVHKNPNGEIRLLSGDEIASVVEDEMKIKHVFEPRGSAADRKNVTAHYQKAKSVLKSALDKEDRFRAAIEKQAKPGSKLYESVFKHQVTKTMKMRELRFGRPLTEAERMLVRHDVGEFLSLTNVENWPLPPQVAKQYYRLQRELGEAQVRYDTIEQTFNMLHEKVWKQELRTSFVNRPENMRFVVDPQTKKKIAVNSGGLGGGQVYVMDKNVFDTMLGTPLPFEISGPRWGWWADALGTWKWLVTQAVPAFWVRNFFGDMQNSILAQGGVQYASQFRNAMRVARYIKLLEKHEREINPGAVANKKLEELGAQWINLNDNSAIGVARRARQLFVGGDMTGGGASVAQIARWALEDGVANAGLTARDIASVVHHADDFASRASVKGGRIRNARNALAMDREFAGKKVPFYLKTQDYSVRPGRNLMEDMESWSNFRENFAGRLNTYMGTLAQSNGNRRIAASFTTRHHFDYGNLNNFEQRIRNNLMPFYTWNARNLPLWTAALWQRPGMLANYQMAREEAAFAAGIDPNEYETKLSLTEQGTFPFPVRLPKGTPFGFEGLNTLSLGSGGTSISSTNYSPAGALADAFGMGDVAYLRTLGDYVAGLINPAIKIPIELGTGYSFYLHNEIVPPSHSLTQAPKWTKAFADLPAFKSIFGWVPDYYDKNGQTKKIPGWSTKVDYLASQAPGALGFLMRIGKESSKNPLSYVDPSRSALSFVTGVRLRKYDPYANEYRLLLQLRSNLQKDLDHLHEQKNNNQRISSINQTRQYTQINEIMRRTRQAIAAHEDYFQIPRSGGSRKSTNQPKLGGSGSMGSGSMGSGAMGSGAMGSGW